MAHSQIDSPDQLWREGETRQVRQPKGAGSAAWTAENWRNNERPLMARTPRREPGVEEMEADARLWNAQQMVIGGALWLVGAVALALLSVAAHNHPVFPGDVGMTTLAQRTLQPVAGVVNFSSAANWPKAAGIIAIAVIIGLLALRQVRAAICAAISGFGADFVNVTLNGAVARPRPNNVHIHVVAHLGLHSYPSGHVTHVIAFYGFLLYLSLRQLRFHPRLRPILLLVAVVCAYFIICIGPSRVLEGEHWPSDVLASYLLGALVLTVAVALYHLFARLWVGERRARGDSRFALTR